MSDLMSIVINPQGSPRRVSIQDAIIEMDRHLMFSNFNTGHLRKNKGLSKMTGKERYQRNKRRKEQAECQTS